MALAAWGAALVAGLLLGCAAPLPLRVGGAVLVPLLLWPAMVQCAGRQRLGADADGRWWLSRGPGRVEYVQLRGPPLILGDWVWLRLQGDARRTFLFIDGPLAEPEAFRSLKVRLTLDPGGNRGR